jgi:hypothetical protein
MSDRDLLELAAKAAGIRLEWDGDPSAWMPMYYAGKTYHAWNPLEDDGDALRMAVKLELRIMPPNLSCADPYAVVDNWGDMVGRSSAEENIDIYTATRRAIVLAAAEIGKAMP